MTERKTIIIGNGNLANAVDELRDALRAAGVPIYPIYNNQRCRLVMRDTDGKVQPLTPALLRDLASRYVQFVKGNKSVKMPGDLATMFLSVATTYSWFDKKETAK
jgi:hypothetical protein